jgi:hypothetical protein
MGVHIYYLQINQRVLINRKVSIINLTVAQKLKVYSF